MRDVGPQLGELHWEESTGLGKDSKVLPEEAMGMLGAARAARRLRGPSWRQTDIDRQRHANRHIDRLTTNRLTERKANI